MKTCIYFILSILIIISFSCRKEANFTDEYIARNKGTYQIEIPEVYELANVIIALEHAGTDYKYSFINNNSSYYSSVLNHFQPYISSKIFTDYTYPSNDFTNNYSFRENSYRYKFEGDEIVSKDIYLKHYWSNLFAKHLTEIQEFSTISNFREFYSNNVDYYNSKISSYQAVIPIRDMWDWLEYEFSVRYDCYRIIISPLTGGSHSTQRFETNKFKETLMFVSGLEDDFDLTDTDQVLLNIKNVFTEIDHNYVNPVTDKYITEINDVMSDLSVWKAVLPLNELYDNASLIFNEYMTWAVYDIYVYDKYSSAVYNHIRTITINKMENNRGFIKFREFEDQLFDLYINREQGKTIEELYPDLITWMKEL